MTALRWEIRRWLSSRWWMALAVATPVLSTGPAVVATDWTFGPSFFSVAVTVALLLVTLVAPLLALAAWLNVIPVKTGTNRPSARQALFAKLVVASLQSVAVATLALAPAAIPVALRAVSVHQLMATAAINVAAGLFMVTLTTYAVTRLRSPGRVLVIAYAAALATTFGATFLAAFLPTSDGQLWPPEFSELAGYANPLAALVAVVRTPVGAYGWRFPAPLGDYLTPGPSIGPRLPVWPVYPLATASAAAILSALTVWRTVGRNTCPRSSSAGTNCS